MTIITEMFSICFLTIVSVIVDTHFFFIAKKASMTIILILILYEPAFMSSPFRFSL